MDAIAWALVHFLWQGAALAFLALILTRLASSASVRYTIGVATMAAMVIAVGVTIATGPNAELVEASTERAGGLTEGGTTLQPSAEVGHTSEAESGGVLARRSPGAGGLPTTWILGVWMLGVVALSARAAGGWWVARRVARSAVSPVPEDLQRTARMLAERMGITRAVGIFESSRVLVPVMIGWLRPVVLMPPAALAGLSSAQVEAIFAHEFAHIRRHDYLVNLLQTAVETVLFFHPAVWWVSREIRRERELCCDDVAVRVCDRVTYATALSALAHLQPPSLALAATDGSLRDRVRRVISDSPSSESAKGGWMAMLPLVLVLSLAAPSAFSQSTTTLPKVAPVIAEKPVSPEPTPDPMVFTAEGGMVHMKAGAIEARAERIELTHEPRVPRAPDPLPVAPTLPAGLVFLSPTTQAMVMPEPPPLIAPQAPARRVAAGDTITLDFFGLVSSDEEMRKRYVVRPDGAIEVKHLGLVMVAGKTLREAAAAVLGSLEPEFYPAGFVQVVALPADAPVGAQAPKQEEVLNRVVVLGQVLQSGERVLRGSQMKVSLAIAAAGGFTAMAGQDIEIRRLVDGKAVTIKVTRGQLDSGDDPALQADDIVTVRTGQVFFVIGEVNTGGQKIWAPGMTVGKAISLSNGMTPQGKLGHIQRPAKDADGKVRFEKIEILKTDTEVLPDDTLVINRKWFGN